MSKRFLAILLALTLLCCLFAGCAKQQAAETPAAEPAAEAAPAEETPAEAAPAEETPAAPAEEGLVSDETAAGIDAFTSGDTNTERADITGVYNDDGSYTSTCGITYPISDTLIQVGQWSTIGMFDQGLNSYNELPRRAEIAEKTGVEVSFADISSSAESEQFQLAVAAGTLPEICTVGQLYTGGISAAYTDEVIWDLTDYVQESAPDWWECLQLSTDATIDNAYSSGMILQICGIAMAYEVDQGLFTNQKFLYAYNDAMGNEQTDITNLQSLDGFTAYLKWLKDEKNPTYVSVLDSTGAFTDMGNPFHTGIYQIGTTGIATFLQDGQIVSGLGADGYFDYLSWVNEMYNYGVFDQDFYNTDMGEQEEYMYIGTGEEGLWNNSAASQNGVAAYTDADGDRVVSEPLARVLNEDGVYTFGTEQTLNGDSWSVTTTADEDTMKAVLNYMNYFFTEPGFYFTNWGEEGASYEDAAGSYYFDANGDPCWAKICVETDDTWALWKNTWKLAPYYEDPMVHYMTGDAGDADELKAVNVWTYPDYEVTTENSIPNGAALNADESSQVSTMMTDLCTFADEQVLKFIMGTTELNEENWNAYCDTLENVYNLSGIVAVYQFAYDDYLAGNRTSTASAAAPPPPPEG